MDLIKLTEKIAVRMLTLVGVQGDAKKIEVIIGKPERFADSEDYFCPYKIIGLGKEKIKYAAGIDGIQAIQLAMKMIGADLYSSKEAKEGFLKWEGGDEGDLGFINPYLKGHGDALGRELDN